MPNHQHLASIIGLWLSGRFVGRAGDGFVFYPSREYLEHSNLGRFMKAHGISDWRQLVKRANADIGWYWDAVNRDLEIEWFAGYDRVYDSSNGMPFTKWFLNGKCNIVANAVDKHARGQP